MVPSLISSKLYVCFLAISQIPHNCCLFVCLFFFWKHDFKIYKSSFKPSVSFVSTKILCLPKYQGTINMQFVFAKMKSLLEYMKWKFWYSLIFSVLFLQTLNYPTSGFFLFNEKCISYFYKQDVIWKVIQFRKFSRQLFFFFFFFFF